MRVDFIDCDRETQYLLPPSVADWLPEGHLARFVVEVVEQLDLGSLRQSYSGRGSRPYNPEMLAALLFYGYATGVFSSRKLERATFDSVAFRYIAANTHPDHDTIAAFRRRFVKELENVFVQILLVASQMKVLKLGSISLDGTKVKANASKHSALSYERALQREKQYKDEIAQLLLMAEKADQSDTPDGMDIPEELAFRRKRLEAIANAKTEIERQAAERDARKHQEYEKKLKERADKERKTGRKPRGRKPQPPAPGGPASKDQVNLTDGESRIMPVSGGGFEQAYNAQSGVDASTMMVIISSVSQSTTDSPELATALTAIEKLPDSLGEVNSLIADCGYYSGDNINACEQKDIIPYIAYKRDHHHKPLMERWTEPPPLPDNADSVTAMKHRLQTSAGKAIYAIRKSTVEPVFGIIKSVMGFRSFTLRGLKAVQGEWSLACAAWNIKRLHALTK